MTIVWIVLVFNIFGSLGAWQPDIDINRVRLVTNDYYKHSPRGPHSRRSILSQVHGKYDNDYYSSRYPQLRSPIHFIPHTSSAEQMALKVHQPREDPRLFYQSDAYVKEVNENKLNNEVTAIYPGRNVVQAGEEYFYRRPYPTRLRQRKTNDKPYDLCVTCPHDRTMIAKPWSDRVMLQHPILTSCYGYKVPREVKFTPMFGPKFGSLLEKGSYRILGQIKYKNKLLKYCYMNVDVLVQTCALPKYLIADCADQNKTCSFTCRDPKRELLGPSILTCGDDMKWIGNLPLCNARKWCEPLPPPDHGRVSCKGNTVNDWGLAEGASCRLRCARGWKWNTRPMAVCRRGAWSQDFSCVPINN